MLYGGIKQIDLHLNFSNVDAYAVDKFLDFVPKTVMNAVETVTPDSNLINFDNVICSQLVESHCRPLDLPKESYMYMYEVSFDTLQDYYKRSIVCYFRRRSHVLFQKEKVLMYLLKFSLCMNILWKYMITLILFSWQPNHLYQSYFVQCQMTLWCETVPLLYL